MDARLLVTSKWMVSESFGLGDVPKEPLCTISSVTLEQQEGDKGKENWGILYFVESWAKPLKVNRTHQKALVLMFGNETDHWKGKRIGLYAMAGTFFGKQGTAVRIKGSPDLKAPCSFRVKKFGGGHNTYDLVPMGGGSSSKPVEQKPAPAPKPVEQKAPEETKPVEQKPAAPVEQKPTNSTAAATDHAVTGPVFGFGPHKHKPIERAETSAVLETIQAGEEKILGEPNAAWAPTVAAEITRLRLELERRFKLSQSSQPPEPGSDG